MPLGLNSPKGIDSSSRRETGNLRSVRNEKRGSPEGKGRGSNAIVFGCILVKGGKLFKVTDRRSYDSVEWGLQGGKSMTIYFDRGGKGSGNCGLLQRFF